MGSLKERIEAVVKELQSKGEEPTSYRVARILGLSESTVYYYWRTGQISISSKVLLEEKLHSLRRIMKDLGKKLREFQDILAEVDCILEDKITEKKLQNTPVDVSTKKSESMVTINPVKSSSETQGQRTDVERDLSMVTTKTRSSLELQKKGVDEIHKQVSEFLQLFRQFYKAKYNSIYAQGGYSAKEKSQVYRLIKTLNKEELSWKKYLQWCFQKAQKTRDLVLTIGLISCREFLQEFIVTQKNKEIPEWIKKKENV